MENSWKKLINDKISPIIENLDSFDFKKWALNYNKYINIL